MFIIRSIKTRKEIIPDYNDAIQRAKDLDAEYQPAFGVQVESENGETVFSTEHAFLATLNCTHQWG